MAKIKLFCFPFAGGASSFYLPWKQIFNGSIEIVPIELKGRGRRINETHYQDFDDLVEDVFQLIKEHLVKNQYASFGHSMGALISFRLHHKIKEKGFPLPNHLFLSGKGAPHVLRDDPKIYHTMDDETFKNEVINLGGTSKAVFQNRDLYNLFLPLLKNDFRICEQNLYDENTHPIKTNITVFTGKDDDITLQEIMGWEEQTLGKFNIHFFEGRHFFLNDHLDEIKSIIYDVI
jgi:surfactin synthase thioesterase subunit